MSDLQEILAGRNAPAPSPKPESGQQSEAKPNATEKQVEPPSETRPKENPEAQKKVDGEPGDKGEAKQEETPKQKMVPHEAFAARVDKEKQENRALRRELAQIRAQINQQQQTKTELPDPLDDPKGYWDAVQSQTQKAVFEGRLSEGLEALKDQHGEDAVEDAISDFMGMANEDSTLVEQFNKAPSPARFMWRLVERERAKREIGDPAEYQKKVKAEAEAEAMAKVEELVQKQLRETLAKMLPESLATEQSQVGRTPSKADWSPTPLKSIIGKK